MDNIILIKGKVNFTITLDPGTWLFDDRKVDLNTYFNEENFEPIDELLQYKKSMSEKWEKGITEGSAIPRALTTENKTEKQKLLTGSFGIPFKPFLKNANPIESATCFIIEMADKEESIPLESAQNLILGFSKEGMPLTEDGPVHVYFGDGSNKETPFKNVKGFRVE